MNIIRIIILTAIFGLSTCTGVSAQEIKSGEPQTDRINFVSDHLVPGQRNAKLNEVGEIKFEGNSEFDESALLPYISSSATSRSIPHKVLQTYHNEFSKNDAAPKVIVSGLDQALNELKGEIRYFDEASAANDCEALWHYYNINGYHYAKINFSFVPSKNRKKNILTFHIDEGPRFSLNEIVYIGLDSLPREVERKLRTITKARRNKYFNEPDIINEINQIHEVLLNNGYYSAYYTQPEVTMDTVALYDSVVVFFDRGTRVKFGEISYIDSTKGQPLVVNSLKKTLLEINKGQWYSRRKLNNSIDNLLSIGTFESVSIDTSSIFYPMTDTSLAFRVLTQYRKQRDWYTGLFLNQTSIDGYTNAGLEGAVYHRNLFGAAQAASFNTSVAIKDIFRLISDPTTMEYEFQLGGKYSQPVLWVLDNSRIGLSTSLTYSIRRVNNFFQINSVNFPIRFPVKLPSVAYFNNMTIEFNFDRDIPVNYESAVGEAAANAKNSADSTKLFESLLLYSTLYEYSQQKELHLLTSNLIGITLTGDSRNHPFSPTRGNYTMIGVDGWNVFLAHPTVSGLARYFRFQFLHTQFFPLAGNVTAAFKGRLGGIYLMEKDNFYVPWERQFFSGGANSVRGWSSRSLRYINLPKDSLTSLDNFSKYLENFVGNGGIVEMSAELRYRLMRPRGWNEAIANQVASLGITFFADAGNSFHWLALRNEPKIKFTDYFTKLAVSAGLGLRYETPVGPVRIDFAWPVYDPMKIKKPFTDLVYHIGIGHAF